MFSVLLISIFGLSVDCPDIINLALGMNMHIVDPSEMDSIQSLYCSGAFDSNHRVTYIQWSSLGLNGTINGTALPPQITRLDLNNNKLTGAVPSSFPPKITFLKLGDNLLTELPPAVVWPPVLDSLYLYSNLLTGDISLQVFPADLTRLNLGTTANLGNQFSGTLTLNRPTHFYITSNWITDIIINDSSLIFNCDISNNPLLDSLNLAVLSRCNKNGLYSPSLLPNTKSTTTVKATKTTTNQISIFHVSASSLSSRPITRTVFSSSVSVFTTAKSQNSIISFSTQMSVETRSTTQQTDTYNINYTDTTTSEMEPNLMSMTEITFISTIRSTSTDLANANGESSTGLDSSITIVLLALGAFAAICVVVLIAGKAIKNPKINSKFGRKSSWGTLNTIQSTKKTFENSK